MRKMNLILIVLLLLCAVSIFGKSKEKDLAVMDTLRFKLLPSVTHNIQISAANIDKNIYFIDDITLNKADFNEKGMSTILNADLYLTDVIIHGKGVSFKQYTKIKPETFEPVLRLQAYTDLKGKCRQYEILFDDVKSLPDTFKIKLKYHIMVTDSLQFIKVADGKVTIPGNTFWYPRNINQNESVKLSVKTSEKVAVSLNNTDLAGKTSNYLKTSEVKFTDAMENPVDLTFRKM